MLQINDLTITCRRDLRTVVEHLNLTLGPGDRCAVIGEEGNGKSTLLRLLCDSSLVEGYAEWSGSFSFGRDRRAIWPRRPPKASSPAARGSFLPPRRPLRPSRAGSAAALAGELGRTRRLRLGAPPLELLRGREGKAAPGARARGAAGRAAA